MKNVVIEDSCLDKIKSDKNLKIRSNNVSNESLFYNQITCEYANSTDSSEPQDLVGYAFSKSNDQWMTVPELAEFLRLSVGAVRNLVSAGELPYHKLGARVRFSKNEIIFFLLSKSKGKNR